MESSLPPPSAPLVPPPMPSSIPAPSGSSNAGVPIPSSPPPPPRSASPGMAVAPGVSVRPAQTGIPHGQLPLPARRAGRAGLRVGIAAGVLVVLAAGLAWDATRSGPVWHALRKAAGLVEAPHPTGRWYEFGHRLGRTHAGVCAAFETAPVATAADLAYALKSLGVENPPREVFEMCLRGYEDGVAGRERRYATDGKGADGFPTALENL